MRRDVAVYCCICLLVGNVSVAEAQDETPPWFVRLANIFGIFADPGKARPLGGKSLAGDVWVVDLNTLQSTLVAQGGSYHSPVFLSREDIVALEGETIVRFPEHPSSPPTALYRVPGIDKLIAAEGSDPGSILVLFGDHPKDWNLAVISLEKKTIDLVPVNKADPKDVEYLRVLAGWDRWYDGLGLRVQEEKDGSTDVFFVQGGKEAVPITNCVNVDCGQPSLSPDHDRVVFIKGRPS